MATAQEFHRLGVLERIDTDLDQDELPQRCIYALPRAIRWMEDELPGLQSDGYFPGALSPLEQAEAIIYQFISGALLVDMPPKCLHPEQVGIWELRTHDLRFFGWFWRKGIFILSSVDTKVRCLNGLYGGHRNQARDDRNRLDLDPPKFIEGGVHHVL